MSNKRFILSIIALYIASLGQFIYNTSALYVFWPLAFVLSGISLKDLFKQEYFKYYCVLWVPFLISWAFAVDGGVAYREIRMMLGVVLTALTFFSLGRNPKTIPWLYGAFAVFYAGMFYYVQKSGILLGFDIQSQRLDMEGLNANFFGYYTFYLTFAIFILADIVSNSKLKALYRYLFFAMIPLSAVIALLTASRQILIVQVPVVLALLYVRYFTRFKAKTVLIALIAVCAIWILYGESILDTFDNSMLNQRSQLDVGEDARTYHLLKAFGIGADNFLVGVGPGCYSTFSNGYFSHCTYTELFANYGIFTACFYIWILSHFAITQWRRYRTSKDNVYLSFFVFGVIFIVDNFFYVFYTGMWLMAFFFLIVLHSEQYYKQQITYR